MPTELSKQEWYLIKTAINQLSSVIREENNEKTNRRRLFSLRFVQEEIKLLYQYREIFREVMK